MFLLPKPGEEINQSQLDFYYLLFSPWHPSTTKLIQFLRPQCQKIRRRQAPTLASKKKKPKSSALKVPPCEEDMERYKRVWKEQNGVSSTFLYVPPCKSKFNGKWWCWASFQNFLELKVICNWAIVSIYSLLPWLEPVRWTHFEQNNLAPAVAQMVPCLMFILPTASGLEAWLLLASIALWLSPRLPTTGDLPDLSNQNPQIIPNLNVYIYIYKYQIKQMCRRCVKTLNPCAFMCFGLPQAVPWRLKNQSWWGHCNRVNMVYRCRLCQQFPTTTKHQNTSPLTVPAISRLLISIRPSDPESWPHDPPGNDHISRL